MEGASKAKLITFQHANADQGHSAQVCRDISVLRAHMSRTPPTGSDLKCEEMGCHKSAIITPLDGGQTLGSPYGIVKDPKSRRP